MAFGCETFLHIGVGYFFGPHLGGKVRGNGENTIPPPPPLLLQNHFVTS